MERSINEVLFLPSPKKSILLDKSLISEEKENLSATKYEPMFLFSVIKESWKSKNSAIENFICGSRVKEDLFFSLLRKFKDDLRVNDKNTLPFQNCTLFELMSVLSVTFSSSILFSSTEEYTIEEETKICQ